MQQMEMFSSIKMWPKGLSGTKGYTTLQIYRELMLCLFCLSCGRPGLSADCRIELAVCTQMVFSAAFYQLS